MKFTRRSFLKSSAVAASLPAIPAQETKAVPYMEGSINNGNRLADGIMPLEGELITVYRWNWQGGLYIGEGQYRDGKFYIPDFTDPAKPFSIEFNPDSWNIGGLTINAATDFSVDFTKGRGNK